MSCPSAEIWIASGRGVAPSTRECCERSGLRSTVIGNINDTALARNITLTKCVRSGRDFDVVLLVDDDMVFHPEAATSLVSLAHEMQAPVSAAYLTREGDVAATPMEEELSSNWKDNRWLTGLGLVAIPLKMLKELALKSVDVSEDPLEIIAFCWSGPGAFRGRAKWFSEDYCLLSRLGGAILMPVGAGHLKTVPIWPSEESLKQLAETGQISKKAKFTSENIR
jgi:hypothetical protein